MLQRSLVEAVADLLASNGKVLPFSQCIFTFFFFSSKCSSWMLDFSYVIWLLLLLHLDSYLLGLSSIWCWSCCFKNEGSFLTIWKRETRCFARTSWGRMAKWEPIWSQIGLGTTRIRSWGSYVQVNALEINNDQIVQLTRKNFLCYGYSPLKL